MADMDRVQEAAQRAILSLLSFRNIGNARDEIVQINAIMDTAAELVRIRFEMTAIRQALEKIATKA
ncbi:hypothetical protein [Mesorhizobium caraganae]|uniref:hypothetical protein n=1 Tax=Mesorhizobium caraganae TaxID=483206 RepID=UPI0033378617